jgi:hypothetical protein
MHCNPWYALKYCCNFHIEKWSSRTKRGFSPFPHHTWRQMDIIITRDNFQTLTNIVIANPTHTNLVQHASTTIVYATIVVVQDKTQSYIEQVPRDDFIPLAIETYGCLHPRFDSFLTSCVHAYMAHHQQTSLVPSMLIFHYRQQMSIAYNVHKPSQFFNGLPHLVTILHLFHTY